MELVPTPEEVTGLGTAIAAAGLPAGIFLEPRNLSVRMLHQIPARWAFSGPKLALSATAAAGEYFTFQIGLWANQRNLTDLTVKFGDLVTTGRAKPIPASAFNAFNLGGVDNLGHNFTKVYSILKNDVGTMVDFLLCVNEVEWAM